MGEIAGRLRLRQPQVSKHLRVLHEAGLVEVRPLAQRRIYRLQSKPFEELGSWLETFRRVWEARLDTLDEYLQQVKQEQRLAGDSLAGGDMQRFPRGTHPKRQSNHKEQSWVRSSCRRLEFTQGLSDKDGNRLDPAQVGLPPDFPKELHTSIVFKAKGGMTELTITEYNWTVGQMYVYSIAGLHQSIDKLAESLAKA